MGNCFRVGIRAQEGIDSPKKPRPKNLMLLSLSGCTEISRHPSLKLFLSFQMYPRPWWRFCALCHLVAIVAAYDHYFVPNCTLMQNSAKLVLSDYITRSVSSSTEPIKVEYVSGPRKFAGTVVIFLFFTIHACRAGQSYFLKGQSHEIFCTRFFPPKNSSWSH